METKSIPFNKYKEMGPYHWIEVDKKSLQYNPSLEARYKIILRFLKKADFLLDVGCGDGYMINLVSSISKFIVGIEYDYYGASIAQEKLVNNSNVRILQASCYEIPFCDNSFDVVLLTDVIEHLEYPEECIKEIRRVLIKDGSLILTTPKWRPDRMWDKRHIIEYKPEELRECLMNYFEKVEMRYFWPLIWSDLYSTRLGWRLLKLFSKFLYNPFLKESSHDQEKFGQIIVKCKVPKII